MRLPLPLAEWRAVVFVVVDNAQSDWMCAPHGFGTSCCAYRIAAAPHKKGVYAVRSSYSTFFLAYSGYKGSKICLEI